MALRPSPGTAIFHQSKTNSAASGPRTSASAVLADGKLIVPSRRAGVFVLKAGDTFEQLQQNPPLDDSDFDATPAVAGKQLFLRSNKFLYCLESR